MMSYFAHFFQTKNKPKQKQNQTIPFTLAYISFQKKNILYGVSYFHEFAMDYYNESSQIYT